jgi:hypothetical protein
VVRCCGPPFSTRRQCLDVERGDCVACSPAQARAQSGISGDPPRSVNVSNAGWTVNEDQHISRAQDVERGAQMDRLQPAGDAHVSEPRAVQNGEHCVSGRVNRLRNVVADLVAGLKAIHAPGLEIRRDTNNAPALPRRGEYPARSGNAHGPLFRNPPRCQIVRQHCSPSWLYGAHDTVYSPGKRRNAMNPIASTRSARLAELSFRRLRSGTSVSRGLLST